MIGQRIKEIRNNNNLTQEELADGIISRTYLSLIEKGTVQPSTNVLVKLSKRLNCTVNDFMAEVSHFKYNNFEILREIGHYELKVDNEDFEIVKHFIDKEYEQIEDVPLPDSGRIHLIYARYFKFKGDLKRTRLHADKALQKLSTVAVNQHYVNAVLLKAELLTEDGEADAAIDILEDTVYLMTKFGELNISDIKLRFALVKCYIIFKQYYTAHRLIADINHIASRLNITYKEKDLKKYEILLLVKLGNYKEALELAGETAETDENIMRAYSLWQLDRVKEADELLKATPVPDEETSSIPQIGSLYKELTGRLGGL
ncbi:anaerobic benzoate catabolism transcriptional regulator [Jeotgalicoccus saudimassiliensis]|uniref:Anaerobic benzoate catabolism transcriptional regulator n=1 Tax=Jeotgalicoccus saudimassiliensis TaxID=1461582 RepID=A0A078M0F8_9STAP|nr:helix-turn-helix transcriptional regulator [Jeotgalicoccus saudimassiliensis]CDZ98892.1 anaerobic benzoate catabolism transcriptional regulator [Jeotgalicoccus saudimassiliensis]